MTYTLITGASGGIGKELAYLMAQNSHNLILAARSEGKLKEIKTDIQDKYNVDVNTVTIDLSHSGSAEELYNKTEGFEIDILVNNAGFGDCAAFLDSDLQRQREMMQLNVVTLMELCHLYGNDMKKAGKGKILNIASIAAVCPGPYMSVYYASKSCVLSFSQALAEELKDTGITVTALCPGPVETGFEKAANLENSKMFTYFKPAKAVAVAKHCYKAMMNGRVVVFHGVTVKLINAAAKIAPRLFARKITRAVNIRRDLTNKKN